MADYKLTNGGVIRNLDGAIIPNDINNSDWKGYLAWVDLGNTPDPQFTLSQAQAICKAKALNDYRSEMESPIVFGADEIDLTQKGRAKILNAVSSKKSTLKAQKSNGRSKTYSKSELEDLIDAIDNRDDGLLDDLDLTFDAIEAAMTLEELAPYMP